MKLKESELEQLLILWHARLGRTESTMLGLGFIPNHYNDASGVKASNLIMKDLVAMGYAKVRFAGVQPFWKITNKGMRRLLNPESLIVDEVMSR